VSPRVLGLLANSSSSTVESIATRGDLARAEPSDPLNSGAGSDNALVVTATRAARESIWRRGWLTRFVQRHEFAWDLAMGILTVVYVVLAFTEDSTIGPQDYAVWALAGIFLVEFGARCYDSEDRGRYLRSHWLDLITAVPVPGIPGLRLIRLLRLLRFLKVGMLIRRGLLERGWNESGLIWPTLFLFWIGSAIALWLVEHDAPGTTITTFPDAMTAAFLTAATLGFGRHGLPVTQDGQIIAAVIVFFALGLWGFASSNLTRIWLRATDELPKIELEAIRHDLHAMEEELKRLTDAFLERKPDTTTSVENDSRSVADEEQHALIGSPSPQTKTGNSER
jgi:voltage-gated potassium channel